MGRWLAFPNIRPNEADFELVPGVAGHRPNQGPGAMQYQDRGTDYWRIRLKFQHLANEERAAMLAWHSGTRAGAIPFYYDDQTQPFSGTLPNTCIVPNPSMDVVPYSSWAETSNGQMSLRMLNGRLAIKREFGHDGVAVYAQGSAGSVSIPISPNDTYAFRIDHSVDVEDASGAQNTGYALSAFNTGIAIPAGRTWLAVNTRYAESLTMPTSSDLSGADNVGVVLPFVGSANRRFYADNYFVHRAPVVDNGENLVSNNTHISSATILAVPFTQSELTVQNSWFPTFGGNIGARLLESVNSAAHTFAVSSFGKSAERQTWWARGRVRRAEGAQFRGLRVGFFDPTGALGLGEMRIGVASATFTTAEAGGFSETTGWLSDLRGGATTSGWVEFGLRTLTNSTNALQVFLHITSGGGPGGSAGYDGTGSDGLGIDMFTVGRAGAYENYRTSYGRLVATSGTAISSGALQGQTNRIYFKGAPASSYPLAVAGTYFTVRHELHRLTADIATDGAGTSVLEFEPPIRNSPLHHAPIIFHRPYGYFRCSRPPKIVEEFGLYVSLDVELEEVFQ